MKDNTAGSRGPYEHIWNEWDSVKLAEQIRSHYENRKIYVDLIVKYLSGNNAARALEVGCGSAIDACYIADAAKVEVYGIDISPEAMNVARKVSAHFAGKVTLVVGDALSMEFEDNFFDIVFSQGVLEHFEVPIKALKEQIRVLKPGGVLVVNVPQRYTGYTLRKHVLAAFGKWEWGNETEFSNWQLAWYGKQLGIEFIERCGYDYWRSPFEIAFVLRTLNSKIGKIPIFGKSKMYKTVSRFWEKVWDASEKRFGHFFMKNIVYVYRKPI